MKYNFQPHQLAQLAGHHLNKSDRATLDIDDVRVLHFSSSVSPRDYAFGAFETDWTGQAPHHFANFTSKLETHYAKAAKGHSIPALHRNLEL